MASRRADLDSPWKEVLDRYHRDVVSLAVLTGKTALDPGPYRVQHWNHEILHRFPIAKLRDWRSRLADLERSRNPFAVVVLAHLESQDARTPGEKYIAKFRLIRRLYERGYRRKDILELSRFIDWLLALPPGLESKLGRQIESLDREKAMTYVTSWERMGIEKGRKEGLKEGRQEGRQEGLEHGLREAIELGLAMRFGKEGRKLIPLARKLTGLARLRRLQKALFTAESPEEVAMLLRNDRKRRVGTPRR